MFCAFFESYITNIHKGYSKFHKEKIAFTFYAFPTSEILKRNLCVIIVLQERIKHIRHRKKRLLKRKTLYNKTKPPKQRVILYLQNK